MITTHYTQEEIDHAKHVRAVVNGKKGGLSTWQKLSQEERDSRIKNMIEGRKKKSRKALLEPVIIHPENTI